MIQTNFRFLATKWQKWQTKREIRESHFNFSERSVTGHHESIHLGAITGHCNPMLEPRNVQGVWKHGFTKVGNP